MNLEGHLLMTEFLFFGELFL